MRRNPIVVLAACWILVAGASTASDAGTLRVRPLVRDEGRGRDPRRALRASTDAAHLKVEADRAKKWRAFHDDITAKGFDRSPLASRRLGFKKPVHARFGAEQALGVPTPQETLRVAILRVDFTDDRGGIRSTGTGKFDLSGPDTTAVPIDRPPHNRRFYQAHLQALSRYYDAQSYGRVRVEGDVWPRSPNGAYSMTDMADFGPWQFSPDIYGAAVVMFRRMLFAADSQSIALGDRIPWNSIDRIVIIHAGGDLQSDVRQDSPEDIPSFTIGVADSNMVVFPDSINRDRPIDRAAFIPETNNQDGYYGAINGVLAHECGHLFFGFFDVYDVNTGYPVVGFWSLMDSGPNAGSIVPLADGTEIFATGFLPPSVDPWHRFRLMLQDQVPFPEVSYGDTLPMRRSELYPDVRKVTLSSDEYLMVENRYVVPGDSLPLVQDDSTRVVLGPKVPTTADYDALCPGGGLLVWHVDESVLPLENAFPIDTSLRVNPDFGMNSNFQRPGNSVIEADALADLGDPGSPFIFGSKYDPYFKSNNPTLSDTTKPNLIPHIGTHPHVRLDFLDEPDSLMHFTAARTWQLPGWPVTSNFPPGGPQLLAVDVDGRDGRKEVCWAGGDTTTADSAALFAVRVDGAGAFDHSHVFAHLDHRPRPVMAALDRSSQPGARTALFAVSTYPSGPDTSYPGGRVWLVDSLEHIAPGWPALLPSIVTTPPVIAGVPGNATVYVGCADGRVYAIGLDGVVRGATSPPLAGGVTGRLAVDRDSIVGSGAPGTPFHLIAAGGANGEVAIFGTAGSLNARNGWPKSVGPVGFQPDFLWIDFGGAQNTAQNCFTGALSLVVHHANRLWAYCLSGDLLPGWGHALDDTLVSGLGAGDPDGDGYPEVLTQSISSRITFWNLTGYPSPGWPKRGTTEDFRTSSPPLAVDLNGDHHAEVIAMNASGIIAAFSADGKKPPGWPLATGLATSGSPVAADLDHDGTLEIVAPDRFGKLYGYSVAVEPSTPDPVAIRWEMLGGDPGRTSAALLPPQAIAPAPAPGPLVAGSLKVYPNPARRKPVSFAYRLTEPADVEFRIIDTSGHEVAGFTRRGRQSDNLEVWEPGTLPAGLYMARLRFKSAGNERTEFVPVGLLR